MKIKSSLLVSLIALAMAAGGCGTTGPHGRDVACISSLPPNTLVVRNDTEYTFMVYRNGVVWVAPRHTNTSYYAPILVRPNQVNVFNNCTSNQYEHSTLTLRTIKVHALGCLDGEVNVSIVRKEMDFGTNSPPELMVVRSRDLRRLYTAR